MLSLRRVIAGLWIASSLASDPAQSQEAGGSGEPLRWNIRIETSARDPLDATLVASTSIAKGYIVYGTDFDLPIGPRPTRLRLQSGATPTPDSKLEAPRAHRRQDKELKGEYSYFEDHAEFRQRIRLTAGAPAVAGTIQGQTCHETDGTCTLFRQSFTLPLPGKGP